MDLSVKRKLWKQKVLAIILLVILVAVVWSMFSLPTVFYVASRIEKVKTAGISYDTQCSAVLYSHNYSTCYPFLQQHQSCILQPNSSKEVYISASINVLESETTASDIELFQSILSPQCLQAVLPFMCLYLFPLCDDAQKAYLPSAAECTLISTDICRQEWELARTFFNNLPECSALTDISPCNRSTFTASTTLYAADNDCNENFVLVRNSCLPACPHWTLRKKGSDDESDIILILAAVLGLICGIFVLVISAFHYKRMFAFPAIVVVFQSGSAVLLATFAIVGFIEPKALYCTAPDWIESLLSSTPFCAISGSVLMYSIMQVAILWFIHVGVIFLKVRFPFQSMTLFAPHRTKYITISVLCTAAVTPAVPLLVVFTTGGFISARFPPLLCYPKSTNAMFYSLVIPVSVLLAGGVSLLSVVFWIIYKHHGVFHEKTSNSSRATEKKVFIVICYYIIVGVMTLTAIGLNAQTSDEYLKSLAQYFTCESKTPRNCEMYRSKALQYTFPGMTEAAYILLALYPLLNLIYALNFNDLKRICYSRSPAGGSSTPSNATGSTTVGMTRI